MASACLKLIKQDLAGNPWDPALSEGPYHRDQIKFWVSVAENCKGPFADLGEGWPPHENCKEEVQSYVDWILRNGPNSLVG